jgi:hypothetical protein
VHGLSFGGLSVFLEAAVGFFGDGEFYETGFDRWSQVAVAEALAVGKA